MKKTTFKTPSIICGIVLSALTYASVSTAGVIRHDQDDSSYIDLAAESYYSGVGEMIINNSTRCSGTVISSNWVVTAAHCVDESANNVSFAVGGTVYSGINWVIHEDWDAEHLADGYDIALVELNQSVSGVSIAELYRGTDEIGSIGTNVGFGRTGDGLTGSTESSGTKRAGTNDIDKLGDWFSWSSDLLLQDFDNPLDISESAFGNDTPLELEYLIAFGDSGGGLFIEEDGKNYLAGVHSLISAIDGAYDSDYGDLSGSTRVSSFADWIDDIVTPIPEPATAFLFGAGLVGLVGYSRRKSIKKNK